jgi:hypothetical protein
LTQSKENSNGRGRLDEERVIRVEGNYLITLSLF